MPINFKQVGFVYNAQSSFEHVGLNDVSFTIEDGGYVAVIGHTGSGKSTLIQHLNALLKPTYGEIKIADYTILPETAEKNLKPLRQKVGVVFQFSEAQLFEETVLADVMFGPLNFGLDMSTAKERAIEALRTVGVAEELFERSPFELSGGQMRRVSIAGILAIQPQILVLDEPTAGLDPKGRKEMMQLFKTLHKEHQMTIILVTHQMDDVANYADKVLVLSNGELVKSGTPLEVFAQRDWLIAHQIALPSALEITHRLKEKGMDMPNTLLTTDDLVAYLAQRLKGGNDAE